jgi:hypothetical protein
MNSVITTNEPEGGGSFNPRHNLDWLMIIPDGFMLCMQSYASRNSNIWKKRIVRRQYKSELFVR